MSYEFDSLAVSGPTAAGRLEARLETTLTGAYDGQ
jgi:hypothetical protein